MQASKEARDKITPTHITQTIASGTMKEKCHIAREIKISDNEFNQLMDTGYKEILKQLTLRGHKTPHQFNALFNKGLEYIKTSHNYNNGVDIIINLAKSEYLTPDQFKALFERDSASILITLAGQNSKTPDQFNALFNKGLEYINTPLNKHYGVDILENLAESESLKPDQFNAYFNKGLEYINRGLTTNNRDLGLEGLNLLKNLAKSEYLTPDQFKALYNTGIEHHNNRDNIGDTLPWKNLLLILAKSEYITPDQFKELYKENNLWSIGGLSKRKNNTEDQFDRIFNKARIGILFSMLRPNSITRYYCREYCRSILKNLAGQENKTETQFNRLFKTKDPEVRIELAKPENKTEGQFNRLFKTKDPEVRIELAKPESLTEGQYRK